MVGALTTHLTGSSELVRLRNALLLDDMPAQFDWTPQSIPEGFKRESVPPNKLYAEVVARYALSVPNDDWATAIRIGQHLLYGHVGEGYPIQSGLDDTYHRIRERGEGYCG